MELTCDWQKKHLKTLQANYGKCLYYKFIRDWLEPLYLEKKYNLLHEVNLRFIDAICNYMKITTKISDSLDYPKKINEKTGRLIEICKQSNASEYVSGPAASSYLNLEEFRKAGIKVSWFDYEGYPEYALPHDGGYVWYRE